MHCNGYRKVTSTRVFLMLGNVPLMQMSLKGLVKVTHQTHLSGSNCTLMALFPEHKGLNILFCAA